MNAPVRIEVEQPTRHRFTADDVIRLVELGFIDPDARMEILDGELIDMPSEGELHLTLKIELNRFFVMAIADDLRVAPDATLHLAPTDAPEPDIYVVKAGVGLKPVDPEHVRLIVEIADSSIGHDLGRKATKYADYGIVEYWVVDAQARVTHVLRRPDDRAYHEIATVGFDQPLTSQRLPAIALVIAELPGLSPGPGAD